MHWLSGDSTDIGRNVPLPLHIVHYNVYTGSVQAMLEKNIEKVFGNWVRSQGGLSIKLAIIGMIGFPDRTAILPGGRICFIEFKTKTGRVSPQQEYWIDRLRSLGFVAGVARSADEAIAICEALGTDADTPHR